jgi:phosphoenolpyruvate-protein kinase (PTS system EI component)
MIAEDNGYQEKIIEMIRTEKVNAEFAVYEDYKKNIFV